MLAHPRYPGKITSAWPANTPGNARRAGKFELKKGAPRFRIVQLGENMPRRSQRPTEDLIASETAFMSG